MTLVILLLLQLPIYIPLCLPQADNYHCFKYTVSLKEEDIHCLMYFVKEYQIISSFILCISNFVLLHLHTFAY